MRETCGVNPEQFRPAPHGHQGWPPPPRQPHQPPPWDQQWDQQWDQPQRRARPIAPARRPRSRWPLVLAIVIGLPLVLVGSCIALIGAGAERVQEERAGGTVALGETFSYRSGLGLSVSVPVPHEVDNRFIVDPDAERAFAVTVKVFNGTDRPVAAALVTVNATVAGRPVQRLVDDTLFVSQDIAPGRSLEYPAHFKAPKDLAGALQIAATGEFNEPVFFTGQLS
ncbi:hypothetical protein [Pseudonocardia humida]|uniref:DUF4352 domain-containing protein n=1 Tax=Pseudonocardia humida TaxID=2800819 RepID=A0ABT1A2U9_9PSEU|nr:hypothetical protein [Pseudonocardia humida]MCO1657325.1 hypothetical protein [Pseudonocardia humida]